jgi:hypothetical protein
MKTVWTIVKWIILAVMGMYAGLVLDALPATLSLPQGRRPGIKDLTLAQAA